jgi:hypothetical protein
MTVRTLKKLLKNVDPDSIVVTDGSFGYADGCASEIKLTKEVMLLEGNPGENHNEKWGDYYVISQEDENEKKSDDLKKGFYLFKEEGSEIIDGFYFPKKIKNKKKSKKDFLII